MTWFVLRKILALVAIVLVTAAIGWWLVAGAAGSATQGDFFSWLGHLLVGNFGLAADGRPVGPLLGNALTVTLPLGLLALLLTTLFGIALGWLTALRPGSLADRALRAIADIGVATPNFWLGMMLLLAFATGLHWLPPGGFVPWPESPSTALASLLLPAVALALPATAALAINLRAMLVEASNAPAVIGAQSRGATRRDAVRRGRLQAMLRFGRPLSYQFAAVIAGTVIVENVFYLPGLGRLILDAVGARDLGIVRGGVVILVLLIAGTLTLTEIAFGLVDPRRRAEASE
jgi:peptide/nickel transport system permease protein